MAKSSIQWLLCIAVVAHSAWKEAVAASLTLAAPGKTPAVAVVPSGAGGTMRFAASELQKYVQLMTGVSLSVADDATQVDGPRILLTSATSPNRQCKTMLPSSDLPAADSDAFLIRTTADSLVIAGGTDRAVLYGVYDFLERQGCRWLGPGEDDVPKTDSLVVSSINVSDQPVLRRRVLELISGSTPAIVDWMAKVKLNGAWPETYVPKKDMTVDEAGLKGGAVPEMIERGMTVFWGGHVLPFLFPMEVYQDHPEYFAEINGKRLDPSVAFQSMAQLCTSNPDVMRILTENTVKFLRNHP
jgi:hypothetical protein